jgi:CHAT domain-containing protein
LRTLRKLLLISCLAANLEAQPSLADRLLAAPDPQSILAAASEPVDEALFQALKKSAQSRLDKREFPASIREFGVCLLVAEGLQSQADIAASYLGIGLSQSRSGQFTASLVSYEKALPAAVSSGDKSLEATVLRSRSVSYFNLGRFPEGLADSARSLAISRKLDDKKAASFALNNTCGAQMVLGNLRQAAADCEEAYRLSRGFPDTAGVGLGNLGPILAQQGNYEAARDYLEQSVTLLEQQHDMLHLAGTYANLGPVYRLLGNTPKSLESYGKAIQIAHEGHDTNGEAMALFNRAALYSSIDPAKEEADLVAGLRLQEQNESSLETVYGLATLANREAATGRVEQGCGHAGQALSIAQRFASPQLLSRAYGALGYCENQRQNYPKARAQLEEAVRLVESIRESSVTSGEGGQGFFVDKISVYHSLIGVLLNQKDPAAALSVAERARARQLLDTSLRGKTLAAQSMTPAELAEEQRMSDDVARLARRAASTPAPSRSEAQANFDRARREFEDFRGHLYAAHPQLAVTRGDAPPFLLDHAATLLPDDRTLLVEFVTTAANIHIFAIERGPGGKPVLHVHSMAWDRKELQSTVSAFRAQLAARDLGYRQAARSIYSQLMGPLEQELRGKDTLVLVPDGPLWNLPFQALLRPDGAHLLERQNVFYAPSLTYLRETRGRGDTAPRGLLALGNPASAELPNAAREVRSLGELYSDSSGRVLTGAEATRQAWMNAAPDYRILHIATHGILNPANPMYSWLALAQGKDAGDGALEARDILGMNLRAEIAILSACNTARGGVLAGEGLVGMSWAFLAAGARSTVVSQWSVDSAGTTDLMLAFHKNLRAGGSGRARALQKAMLAIKAMPQYNHPFYWAGFVMIGNGY